MVSAAIYGCEGLRLTEVEKRFFADSNPWGFILFARNIESPAQVRALCDELRSAVGWNAPVLIDQEGGRVARLRPPHWRSYPAGRRFGEIYAQDPIRGLEVTRLGAQLIAAELHGLGVDVDCLPVLDVPVAGAHDVIGDRAYGNEPGIVAALGAAAVDGLLAGGVLPVIKHIPGHGRAGVDSHERLPIVDTAHDILAETDFPAFHALKNAPLAMTAHVIYSAIDPERPATTSPTVIRDIIRGEIGFSGCLMSDDLSMQALSGSLAERTCASLAAGCDLVLHCNGKMEEMTAVAGEACPLAGEALLRAEDALAARVRPETFSFEEGFERFLQLLDV
ncbi:MAG: beta-N-acetylhexosaminidase [Alphaproteobacteria bacterium]|nr:beta-N-acetylhexosaminidase [Alphaproteobacteria bacterium]MBO6629901.1 beta-N-acetylhexosaminidase [Alphaproteobacteria bacterium]MDF1624948.1 beta-N-acetylhexosaminidase [Parvibaculaceae bacterium]